MCSEDGRDLAFFLYLQLRECGGTPPQQITIFCSEGWKQPCAQSSVPSAQCSELLVAIASSKICLWINTSVVTLASSICHLLKVHLKRVVYILELQAAF